MLQEEFYASVFLQTLGLQYLEIVRLCISLCTKAIFLDLER